MIIRIFAWTLPGPASPGYTVNYDGIGFGNDAGLTFAPVRPDDAQGLANVVGTLSYSTYGGATVDALQGVYLYGSTAFVIARDHAPSTVDNIPVLTIRAGGLPQNDHLIEHLSSMEIPDELAPNDDVPINRVKVALAALLGAVAATVVS